MDGPDGATLLVAGISLHSEQSNMSERRVALGRLHKGLLGPPKKFTTLMDRLSFVIWSW